MLLADLDGVEDAEGFGCIPEQYDEMEAVLVPDEDRLADNYGGYSFVFLLSDIGMVRRRV